MKNITDIEIEELINTPVPGRYLCQRTKGGYIALKIDFKGNVLQFRSTYKNLTLSWLKR